MALEFVGADIIRPRAATWGGPYGYYGTLHAVGAACGRPAFLRCFTVGQGLCPCRIGLFARGRADGDIDPYEESQTVRAVGADVLIRPHFGAPGRRALRNRKNEPNGAEEARHTRGAMCGKNDHPI